MKKLSTAAQIRASMAWQQKMRDEGRCIRCGCLVGNSTSAVRCQRCQDMRNANKRRYDKMRRATSS